MYTARIEITDANGDDAYVAAYLLNEGEADEAHAQAFVQVDAAGAEVMGLVTASPAPFTLLGRLKAWADAFGSATDDAATDNDSDTGFVSLFKRALVHLSAIFGAVTSSANSLTALINDTSDLGTFGVVQFVEVTMTPTASTLAPGEVVADTQVINAALRAADAKGVLHSVTLIDQDDQKAALLIYFLSANVSLGIENEAPSISDANALNILGPPIYIAAGAFDPSTNPYGYHDLGGASIAGKDGIGKVVKSIAGTDDLAIAVVNGAGTPTYSAAGLSLRLGILS